MVSSATGEDRPNWRADGLIVDPALVAFGGGFLVALAGVVVLLGWILDISVLKSVLPTFVSMKANTSVCFILLGLSIAVLARAKDRDLVLLARAAAGFVAIIGILTLVEYVIHVDLRLDELLFRDNTASVGTFSPGRMSDLTAVIFLCLGTVLALSERRQKIVGRFFSMTVAACFYVAYLHLITYLTGENGVGFFLHTKMAVHTALVFMIAALSIFCLPIFSEFNRRLFGASSTGSLLRVLVPVCLVLPVAVDAATNKLIAARLLDHGLTEALHSIFDVVMFTSIVWLYVGSVEQEQIVRSAAFVAQNQLSDAQRIAALGNWAYDLKTDKVTWSEELYRINGVPPSERPPKFSEQEGYYSPESWKLLQRAVKLALDTGEDYEVELEMRRRGGERYYAVARGEAVKDDRDRIVGLRGTLQDVTAERKAKEKVRKAEATFRHFFDNSEVAMFRTRLDGSEVLDVNKKFLAIFGRTKEEMIGRASVVHWAEPRERDEMVRRLKSEGRVVDFPCRLLTKSGDVRYCLASMRLSPEIGVIEGSVVDVTESRRLQEDMNRFKLGSDRSNDIIFITDAQGIFQYVNASFERTYGWESAEIVGKMTPRILKSGLLPKEAYVEFWKTITSGKVMTGELVNKTRGGRLLDIDATVNPIMTDDGRITGYMGIQRDITERKVAQIALETEKIKLSSIIDNTPMLVYMLDAEGRFLLANRSFYRSFHTASDRLIGNRRDLIMPKDQADAQYVNDREVIDGKKAVVVEETNEEADGRHHYLSTKFPVHDAAGKVYAVCGISIDITDRKRSEERSRELDLLKNKFIQIVSHQMRTPLSSVRWGLEELLGHKVGKITKAQEEMLRMSYEANISVIDRIGDLLQAMDIEEGRIRLEKEPVLLSEQINSVIGELGLRIRLKKMKVAHTYAPERLPIQADPERIRDLLRRLADNAIIYTPDGGSIDFKVSRSGTNARVEITDSGIGIPKGEQKRVFDRFYRASNASIMKPDASGLGLYIVKKIVEAHGGKIGVESEEGRGTTVWLELPLAGPTRAPKSAPAGKERAN